MTEKELACTICGLQHFSPCAGYGLRTTVFFAGCPLRCPWCCNPEARLNSPVLVCNTERCIGNACYRCLQECPQGAIYISRGLISIARDRCIGCGRCTETCPSNALFMSSRRIPMEAILKELLKDKAFIMNGGGVTLSGGEPLMHPDEAAALLSLVHREGLHTAIETCGFFDMDAPGTIATLKECDLLLFDIKHSDPQRHRQFTNVDNSRILSNYARVAQEFPEVELVGRTLIVPGFNDDETTLRNIARLTRKNGLKKHLLAQFSSICRDKYAQIGLPFTYSRFELAPEKMSAAIRIFEEEGLCTAVFPDLHY